MIGGCGSCDNVSISLRLQFHVACPTIGRVSRLIAQDKSPHQAVILYVDIHCRHDSQHYQLLHRIGQPVRDKKPPNAEGPISDT